MRRYEITAASSGRDKPRKLGQMSAPDLASAVNSVLMQLPIDIQGGGYVIATEVTGV